MATLGFTAAAVVAGSTALLYLAKRKQQSVRRASLQCLCGKVVLDIIQPAANYKYMETANLQCACHDCVNYCKAVLKEGKSPSSFQKEFFDPGVPTLLLYDSEIVVQQGRELLESMKLSAKTENRRVFASCCGTPIAIVPDHQHLNLVYSNLVHPKPPKECKDNEVPFPSSVIQEPTVLLHAENVKLDKKVVKKKHPSMKIIPTVVAPLEILAIVSRLILLLVMGDYGPGKGLPLESNKSLGIGIGSISEKMR